MVEAPASIIQGELANTFRRNTGEAWACFGERVVSKLAQADLRIVSSSALYPWTPSKPQAQEGYTPGAGDGITSGPGDPWKWPQMSKQTKDDPDPIDELIEICRENADEDLGMHAIESLRRAGQFVARKVSGGEIYQEITSTEGTSTAAYYTDRAEADTELIRLSACLRMSQWVGLG